MYRLLIAVVLFLPTLLGCDHSHRAVEQAMRNGDPFILTFKTANTGTLTSKIYVLNSSTSKLSYRENQRESVDPLWSQDVDQRLLDDVRKAICDSDFFRLPREVGAAVVDAGFLRIRLQCGTNTIEKRIHAFTEPDISFPYRELRDQFERNREIFEDRQPANPSNALK